MTGSLKPSFLGISTYTYHQADAQYASAKGDAHRPPGHAPCKQGYTQSVVHLLLYWGDGYTDGGSLLKQRWQISCQVCAQEVPPN